jgi:hypothetical protein
MKELRQTVANAELEIEKINVMSLKENFNFESI